MTTLMNAWRKRLQTSFFTFLHSFFLFFYYIIAFSIFAFAEYIVAVTNMAYYWTIVEDLPAEQIVVMRPGPLPSKTMVPKATITNTGEQLKSMPIEEG